ncbi:integration host factor subunit beta [Pelagibacterales bacterium SAG-MED05]|nr:integration host factor subunit beta [Pelagibacterales bacterium SAG-MED05]
MSRPELIKLLKKKHPKLNKIQLEKIIDTFFQSIEGALNKKRSIELRGFGTFFIKEIKEKYSARNPKTGELIYVPKKNKVRFRASKQFKEFLNQ